MKKDEEVIAKIISQYGSVIDLKKHPQVLAAIYKKFRNAFDDIPDGGLPCGGVPLPPPPPNPGPNGSGIRSMDMVRQANILIDLLQKMDKNIGILIKTGRIKK